MCATSQLLLASSFREGPCHRGCEPHWLPKLGVSGPQTSAGNLKSWGTGCVLRKKLGIEGSLQNVRRCAEGGVYGKRVP